MRAFIAYFSPLAIARTPAAKEEQVTPSEIEEASLRMVLALLERWSAANRPRSWAVFSFWNPRRGGRWGGRSAWRAIASPTH